jgi:transcriptional regulator with XRE-family HTH domain
MFFNSNIKFLRKRMGRTQDDVAVSLGMKRSTLSGYENSVAQPSVEVLVAFSKYFNVSIDTLVKTDLSSLPESQVRQIERGYDVFVKGTSLRILATTVGTDNEENIELVSEKAKAGYKSGFADPEYISILPTFRLPFLSKQKKYRAFQVSGDSMLPIPNGSWVTGVFIQDWRTIRDRDACIILTVEEGVVFKVAETRLLTEGKFILHSLNPIYEPYEIMVGDIREIWLFVNYISAEIPENSQVHTLNLTKSIEQLRQDVKVIQTRMKLDD